ncbi:Hypothetical protein MVR_LOCUS11 [uncultured virus]|nr:Hypothetical protein MVR_LOCUS11 [uncultured virus]
MCFTGRFNRTLSVLVGFYDDIMIGISDSSRIGAIIIAAKRQLDPYDPKAHRDLAQKELTEAGYGPAETEAWLDVIDEDIDDEANQVIDDTNQVIDEADEDDEANQVIEASDEDDEASDEDDEASDEADEVTN